VPRQDEPDGDGRQAGDYQGDHTPEVQPAQESTKHPASNGLTEETCYNLAGPCSPVDGNWSGADERSAKRCPSVRQISPDHVEDQRKDKTRGDDHQVEDDIAPTYQPI